MTGPSAPLSPDDRRLKRQVRALIAANGGVDGASATVGKTKSTAGRWQDVNDPAFPNIADIAALEETADRGGGLGAGWPHVTRDLARRAGFELVAVPDAPATTARLLELAAAQVSESSDLLSAVVAASADGVVCENEARRCLSEIDDLLPLLAQLRAELLVMCGGAG